MPITTFTPSSSRTKNRTVLFMFVFILKEKTTTTNITTESLVSAETDVNGKIQMM